MALDKKVFSTVFKNRINVEGVAPDNIDAANPAARTFLAQQAGEVSSPVMSDVQVMLEVRDVYLKSGRPLAEVKEIHDKVYDRLLKDQSIESTGTLTNSFGAKEEAPTAGAAPIATVEEKHRPEH